jgi:polysaccharide biosynthesis/export protein
MHDVYDSCHYLLVSNRLAVLNQLKHSLRVAVLLVACSAALPAESRAQAAAEAPASVLSVGDAVRVTVWRAPEMSGEFVVGEDGYLLHPLYRGLRVAGVPIATVESQLGTLLRRYDATPEFVIEPLYRVTISGEVRSPNVYALPSHLTVSQAVMQAGGPTEIARANRVRLIRGGRQVSVDMTNPGSPMYHSLIQSGDQIFIDRRPIQFDFWRLLTAVGTVASVYNAVPRVRR